MLILSLPSFPNTDFSDGYAYITNVDLVAGRSLVAEIDANQPNEMILKDTQCFTTNAQQTLDALKDALGKL